MRQRCPLPQKEKRACRPVCVSWRRYRPVRRHSGSSGKARRVDTLALARNWRFMDLVTITRLAERRTKIFGAAVVASFLVLVGVLISICGASFQV